MWRSGVSPCQRTSSLRLWEKKADASTFPGHEMVLLYKERKGWQSDKALFLLISSGERGATRAEDSFRSPEEMSSYYRYSMYRHSIPPVLQEVCDAFP